MSKKVLFVATVVKTHIMQFHIPVLKMFKDMGWETTVVARNDYENREECVIPFCDHYIDIPFERTPFSLRNITAFKRLKKIICEGGFDIIHCHTPIAGVLSRLAAKSVRKDGVRVFYTAHGFHFFRGAPLKNWIFYYPFEKLCARYTDVLITINKEDFELAKKRFKAKQIVLVNGVGISPEKIANADTERDKMRSEFGLKHDNTVLISVGELRKLKNHSLIISAMSQIKNDNLHYVIVGSGDYRQKIEEFAKKHNMMSQIHLTGYRKDIGALLKMSDIFCFPSLREGLPLALMEAMAVGLPVVASEIRGNVDLIDEGKGGFLYSPDDCEGFAKGIEEIMKSSEIKAKFGAYNVEKAKKYDIDTIIDEMKKLYF